MVGEALMTVAIFLLVICGAGIMLLAFFGCCGSIMENRCMLFTYFFSLLVMFLMMV